MYNVNLTLTSGSKPYKKDFKFTDLAEAIRFVKYHLYTELNTENKNLVDRNVQDHGEFTIWCSNQEGRAQFTIN